MPDMTAPATPAALAAAIAEGLGYTPGLGAHKHFAEKIAQIIARHMPAPASDGEVEAAATWLEGQAKGKRDFVAHAEANRDDWFATMPPEISEDALKEAAEMESAARLLRSLPALRAECAALRSAAEGFDHFAWSAVMADCEEARQGLQGRIDRLRATLTPGHGERALACVREMVEAGQLIRDALDQHLVGEPGPHLVRFRAALDAARRMFPEGGK